MCSGGRTEFSNSSGWKNKNEKRPKGHPGQRWLDIININLT